MGKSNRLLVPWYQYNIKPKGDVALLGFTDNKMFPGDLYDKSLENWQINSDWSLPKKYDTIICLRCAYFAKDPVDFIKKCHENLNDGGRLYVDWAYGDHWRFKKYKVGWVKDNEHEYAYGNDNFLWSGVWDDSFLKNEQFKLFSDRVRKFGYTDIKHSIIKETPHIITLQDINDHFTTQYSIASLWNDFPQTYILIQGIKK